MSDMKTVDRLTRQILNVCRQKQWSLAWDHRGVYLHLEASELIEAIRGKRAPDIQLESGDLLFTFLALLGANGVRFEDALEAARNKVNKLDPLGDSITP